MPRRRCSARKSIVEVPEDPEERTFVNPSSVSPHLSCTICQEIFDHPMRAQCGHTFCKGVACPFRALGCDFIGPLYLLQSHRKTCIMDPEKLPPALRAHTAAYLSRARTQPSITALSNLNYAMTSKTCTITSTRSDPQITITSVTNSNSSLSNGLAAQSETSSTSSSAGPSTSVGYLSTVAIDLEADESSVVQVSDDEQLPPTPPPNLLFRLYQNSNAESRNQLCSFLEPNLTLEASALVPAPKRRRGRMC